jgi:hypothetical protein
MIEYYLKGHVTDRWALQRILDGDFVHRVASPTEQARLAELRRFAEATYRAPVLPQTAALPAAKPAAAAPAMPPPASPAPEPGAGRD